MGRQIAVNGSVCTGTCYHPQHNRPFDTTGVVAATGFATAGGNNVAVDGDIVTATCGHTGTIEASCPSVTVQNKPIAAKEDPTIGHFISTITDNCYPGATVP